MTEPEPTPDDLTPDPPTPANGLTRITFNATSRAWADLEALMADTGDTRTVVLNRAIGAYRLIEELLTQPNGMVIVRPDGTVERIRLL